MNESVIGRQTFAIDGVEIRAAVINAEKIAAIRAEVSIDHEVVRRTGIRNLEKKFASIAAVATDSAVLSIAETLLGGAPRLVRALFFDKTPARNWFVAWHQDRTVTLNRRQTMTGWHAWTEKEGVHHVQPPRLVLDQMVTIRIHVDDADEVGGCLHVIPCSHELGILTPAAVARAVAAATPQACVVAAGDAVIMHPLILHSSKKSRRHAHRRVVHLEYSNYELPEAISWA